MFEAIRRAFAEFLKLPTLIIVGCLVLAAVSYALDKTQPGALAPVRNLLKSHIFGEPQATSSLLAAIAAGIITLTSITISLLLVAVQQAAGALTSEVFDQFLRRRHNQIYFGFFIGLSLYSLVTLATVTQNFNPVFGGALAFFGAVIALYLLILLFYTTINQTRPTEIIEEIHDHALRARSAQLDLVRRTRRESHFAGEAKTLVTTENHGFVARVDLDCINRAIENVDCEIVLKVSIGSFVAYRQVIAEIKARPTAAENLNGLAEAVVRAVRLERQRDIAIDAAYGVEQIEMIAWTSISTSKSNPAPGKRAIFALRDLLARWAAAENAEDETQSIGVVYRDDTLARLMSAFETLAVVSSESMQHQNYIEVLHTFVLLFDRLPADLQRRSDDLIRRILSALGDHVLTAELDAALAELREKLNAAGRSETAAVVKKAHEQLAASVGNLNSRSTRVSAV